MLFTVFKVPISIIQMQKDDYILPYTIKNRFPGMFLVLAEGSGIYNTASVTPINMWKLPAQQLSQRRILQLLMERLSVSLSEMIGFSHRRPDPHLL